MFIFPYRLSFFTVPCACSRSDWQLQEGQLICVTGGAPQLGNWQLQQVLTMTQTASPWWEAEVGQAGKYSHSASKISAIVKIE